MISRVVIFLALCAVTVASPIIRINTVNGQKKSYCCYGVLKPFDMEAKARQGMRALTKVGFDLKKVRILIDMHQKAVEGKLKNVEKEAEDLTNRVGKALKATMKILSDATAKASKTLSEVTEASNDLGQLGKDLQGTETHDMITKIRELIAEKPDAGKKANDSKHEDSKPRETKSNGKNFKDKKADHNKKAKTVKTKEKRRKDQVKKKKINPKDRIPWAHKADENKVAQRLLANAELYENEQVKMARDVIERKTRENKRAIEKTKDFLKEVEARLLQVQNGIKESAIEIN